MPYRSFLHTAVHAYRQAQDDALKAAAVVVRDELRRDPGRAGYTSGAFVTGNLEASIRVVGPFDDDGKRTVAVVSDNDYARYWEEGHHNVFTRKWEHEPRWGPALHATAPRQVSAMKRAHRLRMRGGRAAVVGLLLAEAATAGEAAD